MLVGWRNVTRRPGRLLTSVAAFTLAIVVTLVIRGFADGLYASHTAFARNAAADLWVRESGFGLLPAALKDEVAAISGVQSVTPLWAIPVMANIADRKIPMTLYGYEVASGAGGPWRVAEGRLPSGAPGELTLDQTLARQRGLAVGSELELQGQRFRITGLTAETNSFMAFLAFTEFAEVGKLMGAPGRANHLLVKLKPGVDAEAVRAQVRSGFVVQTTAEVVADREAQVTKVMGAPLRLLEWVALLVGLAVIALTTYAGVLERRGEYGVLRAVGMAGSGIARVILTEVAAGAVMGVAVGGLAAAGVAWVLSQGISPYPVIVTSASLARSVGFGLVMSLVAALLPLRRISTMDPAAVFRT